VVRFLLTQLPITDAGLAHLRDLTTVTGIDLWKTGITGAGLENLKQMKDLSYLRLTESKLGPVGLKHVTQFGKLEYLLVDQVRITDKDIDAIVTLSKLQVLGMIAEGLADPDAALKKVAALRELRDLQFVGPARVTEAGFEHVGKLTALQSLNLNDTGVTDQALLSFKPLKNLETLHINGAQISNAGLVHLQPFSQLSLVSLSRTTVGDAGLEHLRTKKQLKTLLLGQTKVTAEGVKKLAAALPQCKIEWDGGVIEPIVLSDADRKVAEWVLKMGGSLSILVDGKASSIPLGGKLPAGSFNLVSILFDRGMQGPEVDDAALENLRDATGISYGIGILHHPITDVGLERLAAMPGFADIVHLRLVGTKVTEAGLVHLKRFSKLRVFLMRDITDAGLKLVASSHPQLDGLEFGSKVTKNGLAALRNLKLKSLDVNGSPQFTDDMLGEVTRQRELTSLTIIECGITDAGIARLKELPQLQRLNLAGCNVTDAGLEHLKSAPALTYLNVRTTKVSADGVKKLAAALPNCRIESDHGTFEPKK
jgi:Leucine-rich repeat (LRR) protein